MKLKYLILLVLITISTKSFASGDTCQVRISPRDTTFYSSGVTPFNLTTDNQADIYSWYGDSLNDASIRNPIAYVSSGNNRYILNAFFIDTSSTELVTNGNFEQGNTGFTSQYTYDSVFTLQNNGYYSVNNNAHNVCNNFCFSNQNGNYFIANGATSNMVIAYQTTINVEPNTYYYLSYDAAQIFNYFINVSAAPMLKIYTNNTTTGQIDTLSTSPCSWNSYSRIINSGTNTQLTLRFIDMNTTSANYFALDNISMKKMCKAIDTININIIDTTNCYIKILPTNDTLIVSPNTVHLQLSTTREATYYSWSPNTGINSTSNRNPIVTVHSNSIAQYVLHARFEIDSNLVYNGDFSLGNTGFTSQLNYVATAGSQALWPETTYGIGNNPYSYHMYFNNCTHQGNMLIANGATTSNVIVYQTNVSGLTPNTDYAFSCEATNVAAANSPLARLQFSVNGTQLGNIFTPTSTPCQWNTFYQIWHNDTATSATITLLNQNTNADGNDFALDNIKFIKLCDDYDTINIRVAYYLPDVYDTVDLYTCENSFPISFRDSSYNSTGSYIYNVPSDTILIADSIFIVNVHSLPTFKDTIYSQICKGQTYNENGFNVDSTGIYVDSLVTVNGCDSLIYLNLTVNPVYHDTIFATICQGDVYTDNGFIASDSGFYSQNLTSIDGCDSIVNLSLNVAIPFVDSINEQIYVGDTFTMYGFHAYTAGNYTSVFQDRYGCDSTYILHLEVIQLMFPNVITANGDGINDVFEIHDLLNQTYFSETELYIYSRYGKGVYHKKNITSKDDFWDPEKTNSASGSYFYRFKAKGKQRNLEFNGTIEVLR